MIRNSFFRTRIDWILVAAIVPLLSAGLITMYSFTGRSVFFRSQLIWIALGAGVFLALSMLDVTFLRRSGVITAIFLAITVFLLLLAIAGHTVKGVQRWISIGSFSIQPSDPAKLVLILILAKYFSRRHIEIAHVRHVIVSGVYALILFILVFLQPALGSSIIIFFIWLGMVLVSGISKKHLALVFFVALVSFGFLWTSVFRDYQKRRIVTFLNPLTDVRGTGYNAYQSTIAVGAGGLIGKGIGFGTQSRLKFLPEYETDFMFAAFAEEWGFFGALLLLGLLGIVIWRILLAARFGTTNFEVLYGVGLSIFLMSHVIIHVGMNIGLLPITGTPLPFVSYGGSHLLTEFTGLGILMGMRRYGKNVHRDDAASRNSAFDDALLHAGERAM